MAIHRIFGGATRPALFLGVPIQPFILSTLVAAILAGTALVFVHWVVACVLALGHAVAFTWMRTISRTDPWRLHQSLLRLRRRARTRPSPAWGGITYTPQRLRQRT